MGNGYQAGEVGKKYYQGTSRALIRPERKKKGVVPQPGWVLITRKERKTGGESVWKKTLTAEYMGKVTSPRSGTT